MEGRLVEESSSTVWEPVYHQQQQQQDGEASHPVDVDGLSEAQWCLYHRLPEIVQEMAYNIVIDRPDDVEEYCRAWLADLKRLMILNGNARCAQGVNLAGVRVSVGRAVAPDPVRGTVGVEIIEPTTLREAERAAGERGHRVARHRPERRASRQPHMTLPESVSEKQRLLIERVLKLNPTDCEELVKYIDLIATRKASHTANAVASNGGTDTNAKRFGGGRKNRVFGDLAMINGDADTANMLDSVEGARLKQEPTSAMRPDTNDGSASASGGALLHSEPSTSHLLSSSGSGTAPRFGRRIAVSAGPALRADDLRDLASAVENLPVIPKTEAELTSLREAIRACTAFNNFDSEQLEKIVSVMHKETFDAGTEILVQGQPGRDTFYLITGGDVEIIKNGKFVMKMTRGNYFGELELMYSTGGCAATVKSVTPLATYALKKETYQMLLMRQTIALREANLQLVAKVDFFKDLSDYNRLVLAEAFSTASYSDGEKVIRLGERGEWMHIIVAGIVAVIGREEGTGKPFEICRRHQGDVVGELEFLFDHEAVADVVAIGLVRTARLSRKHFENAIGKTADVLAAQISRGDYDTYLRKADEKVIKQIMTSTRKVDRQRTELQTPNTPMEPLDATQRSPPSRREDLSASVAAPPQNALLDPPPHVNGEVLFCSVDGTLYRFPLDPFQDDHICLVGMQEDGTIVHWSEGMVKLTQYTVSEVLGKPIFSLLTDQDNQRVCFELITAATEWIGDWDGFQDAGQHKREALSFTSALQMSRPTLVATVVPSLQPREKGSSGIVLMIGHELRRKPPVKSIDFAPWFHGTFAPAFDAITAMSTELLNPFKLFEGVLPQPGELQDLREKIAAVKNVVDQFAPLVNIDTVSLVDNWQPVNIETLLRRIQTNFATEVAQHHNRLDIKIDPSLVSQNVEAFVDVFQLPEALTRLIHNANKVNVGTTITLSATCHRRPQGGRKAGAANDVDPSQTPALAASGDPYEEPIPLLKKPSQLHVAAAGRSERMEPDFTSGIDVIEFSVHDNGVGFSSDEAQRLSANPTAKGLGLRNVIRAVQTMGGTYKISTVSGSTTVAIFVPLVLVSEQQDKVAAASSTFTTVLVESDTVQRNFFCQYLWGRQHAVLPAQNWADVVRLLTSSPVDVLIIDPDCIQEGDLRLSIAGDSPAQSAIDLLRQYASKTVLIITSETMDEETLAALSQEGLLAIGKPCSAPRFHLVIEKAEQQIVRMREETEKIRQLRLTFQQTNRGAWRKGRLLGKGAFGEVYEAIDVLTGGKMAVKIMKNTADNKALMEEIRTMTSLQHENIIHYFYCEENKSNGADEINIFMELAVGGVLQDKIKALGHGLDKAVTATYVRQILAGLVYIHERGYVHCDIKSANILMDAEDRCKIGDFGTAKLLQAGQCLYETRGSPLYMAPEVWNANPGDDGGEGRSGFNQSADIWSLGCLVMEMATGKSPWFHLGTPVTVMNKISSLVPGVDETPDLSPLFAFDVHIFEFVRACLEVDADKRPTAKALLSLALVTESTDTSAALKALKKAELLHLLSKFVAFQSPPPSEEDEEDRRFLNKFGAANQEDDFFDSDDEDDDASAKEDRPSPAAVSPVVKGDRASRFDPTASRRSRRKSSVSHASAASSAAGRLVQERTKTVNFDLGSDDEDDDSKRQDKRVATRGEFRRGQSIRREANPFFALNPPASKAAVEEDDGDDNDAPPANRTWNPTFL